MCVWCVEDAFCLECTVNIEFVPCLDLWSALAVAEKDRSCNFDWSHRGILSSLFDDGLVRFEGPSTAKSAGAQGGSLDSDPVSSIMSICEYAMIFIVIQSSSYRVRRYAMLHSKLLLKPSLPALSLRTKR